MILPDDGEKMKLHKTEGLRKLLSCTIHCLSEEKRKKERIPLEEVKVLFFYDFYCYYSIMIVCMSCRHHKDNNLDPQEVVHHTRWIKEMRRLQDTTKSHQGENMEKIMRILHFDLILLQESES